MIALSLSLQIVLLRNSYTKRFITKGVIEESRAPPDLPGM